MKLGNKGFAITGILYTIFILFLMILLSVLGGLNIKRKLLEKNIDTMKESLEEKCTTVNIAITDSYKTTSYGKYTFTLNGSTYTTYLSKEENLTLSNLSSLSYIENNAPSTITQATITQICTTETVS